jgi:hypothetical protein
LFFLLHYGAVQQRYAVAQRNVATLQRNEEGDGNVAFLFCFFFLRYCNVAKTFFCLLWSCTAAVPLHLPAEKLHYNVAPQ